EGILQNLRIALRDLQDAVLQTDRRRPLNGVIQDPGVDEIASGQESCQPMRLLQPVLLSSAGDPLRLFAHAVESPVRAEKAVEDRPRLGRMKWGSVLIGVVLNSLP